MGSEMSVRPEVLKNIIIQNQTFISGIRLVRRDAVPFDDGTCYVLTGMRRAGKSYRIYQHIQELITAGQADTKDILYLNLEDDRLLGFAVEDFESVLRAYRELYPERKPRIFLDEVQNIEGWGKFARRLADTGMTVILTGSNAKLLSSELHATLGGRYTVREVWPFSFAEYLRYIGIDLMPNWQYSPLQYRVRHAFDTYLYWGGVVPVFSATDHREAVGTLVGTVLLSDIAARNNLRNTAALKLLAQKVAESVMQPVSRSRLTNTLKGAGLPVSRITVSDYLDGMQAGYLTFGISCWRESLTLRATEQKHYFFDNALLTNFVAEDPQNKLLENLAAVTLARRYGKENLFFWRKGVEVDFVVPQMKAAFQVSWRMDSVETRAREVRALVQFADAFGWENLTILTLEEETTIEEAGHTIRVKPLWKWLLEEKPA